MSAKAIYEATGKGLLNKHLNCDSVSRAKYATVENDTDWDDLKRDHPWLLSEVMNINKLLRV